MCTRPSVRTFISQIITQLETVCNKIPYCYKSNLNENRKWSDIVAGRNPHASGTNLADTQNIATVITSRPSHHCKRIYRMESSKSIQPPTVKKNNKKHQDRRPKIVILGVSHAHGFADELLHQSNHCFNTTGYVKPNAGLTELLNTAKNDSSKFTTTDTIIMIGGSNDIDQSIHDKNLTSKVNFLDGAQNTNVILVKVPVRCDTRARLHINKQIKKYNKKLYKVTKRFKHVKLIAVSTTREHFTKRGLHLNKKGKEILSHELLKNLPTKRESLAVAVIRLPWKNK
jgi:hypothetical protein